jgi:hypothetical protein
VHVVVWEQKAWQDPVTTVRLWSGGGIPREAECLRGECFSVQDTTSVYLTVVVNLAGVHRCVEEVVQDTDVNSMMEAVCLPNSA